MHASTPDLQRNVRLHLGDVDLEQIGARSRDLLTPARVPSAPLRAAQRIAMKLGALDWERNWLAPLLAARRSAVGDAAGPPRFLVRVDEFPYYTSFDRPEDIDMSRRFHEVMASRAVPHLMSVLPQLTHAPLEPNAGGGRPLGREEIALLQQMRRDGVSFAQHGKTHRTRFDSPRRRSELCGLSGEQLTELLDEGQRMLADAGVDRTQVFVPPFNRFDAAQYPALAARFDIICGGPESVAMMGFHGGPLWRDGAVYLPCYRPFYASAEEILPAAARMIDLAPGTWIPLVLHTSWEQPDEFRSLRRLADLIAPFATRWEDFLSELDQSAAAPSAGPGSQA